MNYGDALVGNASASTRHAALFLHSIAPEDKDWLLNQLPSHHVEKLAGLLSEITDLGLPKNGYSLIPEAAKPAVASAQIQKILVDENDESSLLQFLENTSVSAFLCVFESEPIDVISFFFHLHPWPWRKQFIDSFDSSRRFQLKEVIERLEPNHFSSQAIVAKKMRMAVLNAMVRRVQSMSETPVISQRPENLATHSVGAFRRWLKL